MLNIIKAAYIDNDQFTKKFEQLMQNYVDVLIKELENGMDPGQFEKINPKLISYLLIGITEYGYHFMKHEPDISFDEVFSQISSFMGNTFLLNG